MQLFVYIIQALFASVLYGLFAFFVIFRLIANEVVLYAYIWNVVFIALFLILDNFSYGTLIYDVDAKKRNHIINFMLGALNFVSFKTTLYLFYAFILIISRISLIEPDLFNENFRGFVFSIEYCLILLVAGDKFIEHLLKDDERIRRLNAKFEKFAEFVKEKRKRRKVKR